jgi:hypothetical protein
MAERLAYEESPGHALSQKISIFHQKLALMEKEQELLRQRQALFVAR